MKSIITIIIFVFLVSEAVFGQTCNCNQELTYIKQKIETNYAGFKDKVNNGTKAAYDKRTKLALEKSRSVTKSAYCVSLINNWLAFFKDGHIQVGRNRISPAKEQLWVQTRIKEAEQISLSAEQLTSLEESKGITGIYYDENSTSKIAIVNSKNTFRDYAGIVLSSRTNTWLPGQVVLELKAGRDTLKGIRYDKYCIPENVNLAVTSNTIGGFRRQGIGQPNPKPILAESVDSKILSAKTLYIKISTFNQANAKNIDSVILANKYILNKTPNLILDLRDNGGGADFSYRSIIPYLYTQTFKNIGTDVLSTDDNIAGWAAVATTAGLTTEQQAFISDVIERFKENKGKLVSISEDTNITLDSVASYPKKVIILINKNCGSTTEEFLLMAKQSSKVILMGERTAGVLDYANMRGGDFGCMPYMLYWATSKSRRIVQGLGIDNIGLKPDKFLNADQDWIEEAKNYAEN